jgi:hypothetical protein
MPTCWEVISIMPFLADSFNFGKVNENKVPKEFQRAIEDAYEDTAVEVNNKSDLVFRSVAPSGTPDASNHIPSTVDINYRNGTIWIVQTGAVGPITAEIYIKSETIINAGNKTALWVRLI